jgi:hypothetical protein
VALLWVWVGVPLNSIVGSGGVAQEKMDFIHNMHAYKYFKAIDVVRWRWNDPDAISSFVLWLQPSLPEPSNKGFQLDTELSGTAEKGARDVAARIDRLWCGCAGLSL